MSRKPPAESPPEVKHRKNPEYINQTRRYKLITPLYGGGVTTAEADPVTVIRGTEVRGHLRFWWRATRIGKFKSVQEMKKEEDRVWGSTKYASEIAISVVVNSREKIIYEPAFQVVFERDKKRTKPSIYIAPYAAFSLLPDKDEQRRVGWKSENIAVEIQFLLYLQFPKKYIEDIEAAFWAWETFGGIGARVRRGFGALQCLNIDDRKIIPTNKYKIEQYIKSGLGKYVIAADKFPKGVPYLHHNLRFKVVPTKGDGVAAWKQIIRLFQEFRQEKARYGNEYGLSQWPEANEIRILFGKPPNLPEGVNEDILVHKFPRAKLGLPILFHMPHDASIPDTVTLQGKKLDDDRWLNRLASPLILRPLACEDGAVGLAAILEWEEMDPDDEPYTPPGGLKLKDAPGDPQVYSDIEQKEANKIPPLNGEPDILQAFLNFIQS